MLTVTILTVSVMKERLTVIKGFSVTLCLGGVTLVRFLLSYVVKHSKTFSISENSGVFPILILKLDEFI